jgi:hypothetical protein
MIYTIPVNVKSCIPVELFQESGANVLWARGRRRHQGVLGDVASGNTVVSSGRNASDYREFGVSTHRTGGKVALGYADRYGGLGIGNNGGSGRAAFYGDKHLKGIGQTSLLSSKRDESHSTGNAYLEESLREAIFAEVFCYEFPLHAIPVEAIVSLNRVQHWEEGVFPEGELQVVQVRPSFVRPAHLERALLFYHKNLVFSTYDDVTRVKANIDQLKFNGGLVSPYSAIQEFAQAAVRQLAFAHANSLWHNSLTTSNITLEGAYLDFGAASAFPGWGIHQSTMTTHDPRAEVVVLIQMIRSLSDSVQRYGPIKGAKTRSIQNLSASLIKLYNSYLITELLYVFGLSPTLFGNSFIENNFQTKIFGSIFDVWRARSRQRVDFEYCCDGVTSSSSWLEEFWAGASRCPLEQSLLKFLIANLSTDSLSIARKRSLFFTRPRQWLYRESLRQYLHQMLENSGVRQGVDKTIVSKLLNDVLTESRRRSSVLPDQVVPTEFIVSPDLSAVRYEGGDGGGIAIEWISHDALEGESLPTEPNKVEGFLTKKGLIC